MYLIQGEQLNEMRSIWEHLLHLSPTTTALREQTKVQLRSSQTSFRFGIKGVKACSSASIIPTPPNVHPVKESGSVVRNVGPRIIQASFQRHGRRLKLGSIFDPHPDWSGPEAGGPRWDFLPRVAPYLIILRTRGRECAPRFGHAKP